MFREEDSPQEGGHEGERIADESDNNVLENGCSLHEWTPIFIWCKVSLFDELVWDEEDLCNCKHEYRAEPVSVRPHLTMAGLG
jgi:hypothetical protein